MNQDPVFIAAELNTTRHEYLAARLLAMSSQNLASQPHASCEELAFLELQFGHELEELTKKLADEDVEYSASCDKYYAKRALDFKSEHGKLVARFKGYDDIFEEAWVAKKKALVIACTQKMEQLDAERTSHVTVARRAQ